VNSAASIAHGLTPEGIRRRADPQPQSTSTWRSPATTTLPGPQRSALGSGPPVPRKTTSNLPTVQAYGVRWRPAVLEASNSPRMRITRASMADSGLVLRGASSLFTSRPVFTPIRRSAKPTGSTVSLYSPVLTAS